MARLRELVLSAGEEITQDARRCRAILSDICADKFRAQQHVLISAIEEGVIADLLRQIGQINPGVRARLCRRLVDNRGIAVDLAAWAINCWAYALGDVAPALPNTVNAADKPSPNGSYSGSSARTTTSLSGHHPSDRDLELGSDTRYAGSLVQLDLLLGEPRLNFRNIAASAKVAYFEYLSRQEKHEFLAYLKSALASTRLKHQEVRSLFESYIAFDLYADEMENLLNQAKIDPGILIDLINEVDAVYGYSSMREAVTSYFESLLKKCEKVPKTGDVRYLLKVLIIARKK